ncbi:TetR/AcrR family transcriptional regulator [Amycolatopsis cynarae]|uniref:TetR/AcrR family transcriptional regulator n=2 Tax=Amycolatopsis TaxID=1813 RepID=A0A558D6X5_9PSEU|nr:MULTISPECIES: WHG domain-containing protein [Amycolatopsis]TVT56757.1 TetR/AcrR family transcriptional regulator [Amycolatopsis rhizosphaerae]WAL65640.1 TetR/AcrR family transcriptional regulator [Amycolatopsis sp. HUAS 11-8]
MDKPARRGRVRVATDQDIRRTARRLLVERGPEAVTLRAIARELGITAPALYRYYGSRDDLIEHLRLDVIADLAAQLSEEIGTLPGDGAEQLFAICRGFRRWALTHTKEFTLVFASPTGEVGPHSPHSVATLNRADEPFGRIFLMAAGQILANHKLTLPPVERIPPELRDDLATFQDNLLSVLRETGLEFPPDNLDLGTTYVMIQFWARLYGHITLEVFGNYPIPMTKPDAVFDALLADLAREIGLEST